MANSASPSPPASASMWPASARSARLPDQSAPATSTTRNPPVSARVAVSRPRERAAAVCRCGCAFIERIVAGSLLEFDMHRDRTLTLNGQRFHYAEWGPATAPPVLLLHGVTGHARTWDDEAAGLASRYRVLALDQRGHGDSDPSPNADYTVVTMSADVAAFADALGLSRFSIVGLSVGGRVAIGFAGQAPARVERLMIVDIGPEISEAGMLRVGTLMARSPELFASLQQALAFHRLTNPVSTEALPRHRVQHATRPVEGG